MDNINFSSYISIPKDKSKTGIIVIQEWWGLDSHIRNLTLKFANNGYMALAPDLYHNKVVDEPDEAKKLAMSLNFEKAVIEIQESIKFLKLHCEKIIISGFCMGGFLALKTAEQTEVDGVLAFYPGNYDPTIIDISKYQSPVRIFYGDLDHGFDKQKYMNIELMFKNDNKDYRFHLFSGADHAFLNDERHGYNKEVANEAWKIAFNFIHNIDNA